MPLVLFFFNFFFLRNLSWKQWRTFSVFTQPFIDTRKVGGILTKANQTSDFVKSSCDNTCTHENEEISKNKIKKKHWHRLRKKNRDKSWLVRLLVNPLNPTSDQDRISPNNINTILNWRVMRIKKNISQEIISWSNPKFSKLV